MAVAGSRSSWSVARCWPADEHGQRVGARRLPTWLRDERAPAHGLGGRATGASRPGDGTGNPKSLIPPAPGQWDGLLVLCAAEQNYDGAKVAELALSGAPVRAVSECFYVETR